MNDSTDDRPILTHVPSVMTVKQLADYLQVSERIVYNMATAGEVPGAKIANQWRFPKADIDRWLSGLAWANVGQPDTVDEGGE